MNDSPTEERAESPTTPPSHLARTVLGRPVSFWRVALAAGLAAASFATASAQPLEIATPGPMPLLLLALALLFAGPPRRFESRTMADVAFLGLLAFLLVWPFLGALGLARELEATFLALPLWVLGIGAVILGWRFRQQDPDLLLVTFLFAALFRTLSSWNVPFFVETELPWWIAGAFWVVALPLANRATTGNLDDSKLLLGGLGWFVLVIGALTFHEMRHPSIPLMKLDDSAASAAVGSAPLLGWGLGGFDRVMLEFSLRRPDFAPFAARGIFRLAADFGLPVLIGWAAAAVWSLAATIRRRPWTISRVIVLGLAGLWLIAVLTIRTDLRALLPLVLFLWPGVMGQPDVGQKIENPDLIPPFALGGWGAALLLLLATAGMGPLTVWHYERQQPERHIDARAIVPNWSVPHRQRAWVIRERSPEIAQFADPRERLRPVVQDWLRAAPHDELAHIERLRWAERTLAPREATQTALDSHQTLPWSPQLALWVSRLYQRQGKSEEAIAFLEQLSRERGPLHQAVRARLEDLKRREASD